MQTVTPRSTACYRCYKRKVKCSREKPCRNCRLANRDCQYPVRDRNVTVSEAYLRSLEARAVQTGRIEHPPLTPLEANLESRAEIPAQSVGVTLSDPLVEDPTSEVFVSGLKSLRSPTSLLGVNDFSNPVGVGSSPAAEAPQVQRQEYEYYQLDHDTSNTSCSFKLPPYPYALILLDRFSVFVGHDWHWFRRETFRRRLDSTYKDPKARELKDRMWLCRLLTVFALGESYNSEPVPEIRLFGDEDGSRDNQMHDSVDEIMKRPPGTEFFEQALSLLKVRYEDPSIDQVEALNLVAFYSYSLNRKKAAYMYAGLSFRMANILKLHKPSPSPPRPALEVEHRKRVWWTTYCIDRMTSTEMGLPPALQVHQVEQLYPDDSILLPEDRAEFHDAETLTTQVQLAFIHADICENMKSIRKDNTANVGDLTRPILQRLEEVRARLPPHMSFNVENGMPPAMKQMADRSLASLYQRYHQCFVLLIRPLFLKQISYLLAGETSKAYQEDLKYLTNTCDRMTRFGFWESLHLFSGLMILSLAMSVNSRWPDSFDERADDRNTYDTAKGLLYEMIHAGNLGSKGHGQMLAEVEAFQSGLFGVNGAFDVQIWDVDEWINQLLGS
ncbi:transcription factor domain-containing protein [Aspergillus lucknowensis]|uniref:Fungal-specific transcription factor domain-containing protein n=1 Tax=Aspergillus lucknowensis TaxID=176173 RepID=A0ABR4LSV1_9EURO